MKKDLDFISGEFFRHEIPKAQRYLLKYFVTDLQVAFLRYWMVFGEWKNFCDHTGFCCTKRALQKYVLRYKKLTEAHASAMSDFTESSMLLLSELESGQYRC